MKNNIGKVSLLILPVLLTSCSGKTYSIDDYRLTLPYKENFKILQLTDLHFSKLDDINSDLKFMDLSIDMEKPDLIVITGDAFYYASESVVNTVFSYFESKKVPWTFVYGNHDHDSSFSSFYISDKLNSLTKTSTYCKFIDNIGDDIAGDSNFYIDLVDGTTTKYQLIFLDSHSYQLDDFVGYDYIQQSQIDWYKNLIETTKTKSNNSVVNSLLFQHIPLPEFTTAYKLYQDKDLSVSGDGINNEKVSSPVKDKGFFNVIKEEGSTKAMFVGHDHINDSHIMYEGVNLCYGVKSTDNIYHDSTMLGSTSIIITNESSYPTVNRHFHSYSEVKQ